MSLVPVTVDVFEVRSVDQKQVSLPRQPDVEVSEGFVGAPDGPKLKAHVIQFENGVAWVQKGVADGLKEHYPLSVLVTGRKRQVEIYVPTADEATDPVE